MKKLYFLISFILCLFLAACSKKQSDVAAEAADSNANAQVAVDEKLGTKWGDEISSHVTEVNLSRLTEQPIAESQVRYANKQYQGKTVNSISLAAGKISFSIVDDTDQPFALSRDGQNYYLSAKDGQSYQLKYENHTDNTYEVVASVDGIDVLDGSAASRNNAGYVLHPHSEITIEGFRKSDSAVASFTFSKPEDAYAANSDNGLIQNTGIIGTAIYQVESLKSADAAAEEKPSKYAPPPKAFPADKNE
ncbi:hypothetical protein A7P54_08040 [Acinetobacter sp. Ac_3412]|uniref:hypothetical protein n=1 Tax=Acinetobacter sp. Ac_3412 TaxID=1848935 RepID=UPI00148FE69E|nr:hypothetical protein [Acinetobacter sp. Ac_3412]NNP76369.1 hypothetical protein [Acinetobacter sp. Ac_3412]